MNRFYRSLLLTGIVAAGLVGCGDDVTVADPPAPPRVPPPSTQSVTITPGVQLNSRQSLERSSAVTMDAGRDPGVTGVMGDAPPVIVRKTGLVRGLTVAQRWPAAVRATTTCAPGVTSSFAEVG